MATSFSGGRSQSTRREPPTVGQQLVNLITCGRKSSAHWNRNEYQISTYSPVGTPGYRNEYQISTYSPVGTPGLGINSLPAARYIILQGFSQIVCVCGGVLSVCIYNSERELIFRVLDNVTFFQGKRIRLSGRLLFNIKRAII